MAIILYARVSTTRQADRELSIPAQFNIMERYARDHGLVVAGTFQDVASGTGLRGRPGLMAALREITANRFIDGLLVHKIDRLSRNVFNHLILKNRLRSHGVRILSVIETIEATPLGEFMEHIMAAHAEFYSANLSAEVKKGLDERLRRGLWSSSPPLGYLMRGGQLTLDPARARFIRLAFELWGAGSVTLSRLAEQLHQAGLVGRNGRPVRISVLARLLRNRIYLGELLVNGTVHQGTHPPLVSPTAFAQAEIIFSKKRRLGVGPPKRHAFVLARLVACPSCGSILTGEVHRKKSGKVYRYYGCHRCGYRTPAAPLEDAVLAEVLRLPLSKIAGRRVVVNLRDFLTSKEIVERQQAMATLIARVDIGPMEPKLTLTSTAQILLVPNYRKAGEAEHQTEATKQKTA